MSASGRVHTCALGRGFGRAECIEVMCVGLTRASDRNPGTVGRFQQIV